MAQPGNVLLVHDALQVFCTEKITRERQQMDFKLHLKNIRWHQSVQINWKAAHILLYIYFDLIKCFWLWVAYSICCQRTSSGCSTLFESFPTKFFSTLTFVPKPTWHYSMWSSVMRNLFGGCHDLKLEPIFWDSSRFFFFVTVANMPVLVNSKTESSISQHWGLSLPLAFLQGGPMQYGLFYLAIKERIALQFFPLRCHWTTSPCFLIHIWDSPFLSVSATVQLALKWYSDKPYCGRVEKSRGASWYFHFPPWIHSWIWLNVTIDQGNNMGHKVIP